MDNSKPPDDFSPEAYNDYLEDVLWELNVLNALSKGTLFVPLKQDYTH